MRPNISMGKDMTHSPVFIVGCPRSGTNLLRDLLRSHPNLAFPGESHFIPEFYKGYGDPKSGREGLRLASKILRVNWVRAWGLQFDLSAFAEDRSYRQVVSRIYDEWARKQNKSRWGDKTPHYVTKIPILLEIFPSAKIIHIYRDGRDVALSWLRVRFGPRNVFAAAKAWKEMVSSGRQVGASLPDETYLEVRYESLLSNPADVMKRVCAFIGEPFADVVLRPTAARLPSRHRPIIGVRRPRRSPASEIISTNTEKWKKQMSLPDRILFESVAGDLLQALGYETEGVMRTIRIPEQLIWKADNLLRWMLIRVTARSSYRLLQDFLSAKWAHLRHRLRAAVD